MDFSWHHSAAVQNCIHDLAATGRKVEQMSETVREVGPAAAIAKIINAVRGILFLFTPLTCGHQGRSRRVSKLNEAERGCRRGERVFDCRAGDDEVSVELMIQAGAASG
jgi:hypothetical protein